MTGTAEGPTESGRNSARRTDTPNSEAVGAADDKSPAPISPEDRLQLSRPALNAFFNLAVEWNLSPVEQRRLLGGPSPATLRRWRRGEVRRVASEPLQRISCLLGIYNAINTLLPEPARSAEWMRKANSAPLFGGRSALEVMVDGDVETLRSVRRYLKAQLV